MSVLREVIARFGVGFDTKELKDGNAAIVDGLGKLKDFAGALGGALALGAIKNFIGGLVEEADALNDQADALGLSTTELQAWSYAAELGGSSAEKLLAGIKRLQTGVSDKGLKELGIKTKEATGELRPMQDVVEDVADAIAGIQNPTERNAKAAAIFGKNFAGIVPLLNKGGDGIRKLRAEFEELGGGFTEDFIENAAQVKDETDRLHFIWQSFKVTIAGSILPTVRSLATGLVGLAKPLLAVVRHSEALKAGAIALGVKGLALLSSKIGPLGAAFRVLGGFILRTLLPLIILEDFLVFLAGGDSLIGRAIDKAFGAGTADKVRSWVSDVKKEVLGFIDDLKNRPLKLLEDWQLFTKLLSKDLHQLFGKEWGDLLDGAGSVFVFLIDLLTGGWDNFVTKWNALGEGMILGAKIIATEIKFFFLDTFAALSDKWDEIANKAKTLVGKAPGRKGTAVEEVQALLTKERLQLASEGDSVGARLTGSRGGSTTVVAPHKTDIHITVPPGTPATLADRVGKASKDATQKSGAKNLRATQAALVRGGG